MIFVLRKAGMMSSEYDSQVSDKEIVDFNYQFEIYDKPDNTFFDILTVANLAYDVNKRNGNDLQNSVTINLSIESSNYSIAPSIIPDKILKKNYFFDGTTANTAEQKYMYDLISANTEKIDIKDSSGKPTGEQKYKFEFKCTKTEYNTETTGKIRLMEFKRENN